MTQDTRKDRRVKIVSLNVRYKSATVDEFIENHAHDVSRGGIFIKTANPFPPGTLLKFEIRLSSDQAVIAGVGRIVWKRDSGTTSGERPAGMGVKFIKIDEPSKAIIDRLVNTKDDAGKSFESGDEATLAPERAKSNPPAKPPATPSPLPEAASQRAPAARSATPIPGMPGAGQPLNRRATIMGMGVVPAAGSSAPPAPPSRPTFSIHSSAPPRPTAGNPMFPAMGGEAEMPAKEDQTVMRQAAELLEDALREAGGSMSEIGTNPLFSGSGRGPSENIPSASVRPSSPVTPASEWTTADTPKALAATVAALRAEESHKTAEKRRPDVPPTARDTPTSKRAAAAVGAAANKNRNTGTVVGVVIAVAFAVAGAVFFRDQLFGSAAPPEPVAAPAPPPAAPTTTAPAATTMASVTTVTIPPLQTASAASAATSSAPSVASAPLAASAATSKPTARPTANVAPTPAVDTAPLPRPAKPPPKRAPSPAVTEGTPAESAPSASEPAPKPATAPKPKPEKPSDDNPY